MKLSEYEKLEPIYTQRLKDTEIRFYTPTTFTYWRAKSFLIKEPCTIDWLNCMTTDSYLLDVGANMGVYSLYAALLKNVPVTAIEPEVSNAYLLKRNILLNDLNEKINLWVVGISDTEGIQPLYMNDMRLSGSCHSLGQEVDFSLLSKKSRMIQHVYGTTIDKIVDITTKIPTHIKIDVDGLEHRVIDGARKTLQKPHLKSLCVELNTNLPEHRAVKNILESYEFAYEELQVKAAMRTTGPFTGVAEHIFYRK